jgi:uncharacterized protein YodC (DUF2158 family)
MNSNDSNTESDIKPGDVVYLKSGSPPLTVYGVTAQGCSIAWFDESIPRNVFFTPVALTKVNPAQLNVAQAQLDAAYAQHNEDLKQLDALVTERDALRNQVAELTPASWVRFGDEEPPDGEVILIQTMESTVPPFLRVYHPYAKQAEFFYWRRLAAVWCDAPQRGDRTHE